MDGFTRGSAFFSLPMRAVWGTHFRAGKRCVSSLNTNNHPVSQYRAIGTLQNMPGVSSRVSSASRVTPWCVPGGATVQDLVKRICDAAIAIVSDIHG